MHKYILKRLLLLIPVLIGITFIVFTLSYIAPGDPARMILGEDATLEAIAQVREELGLDDPFFVRFFNYLLNAARLDFGNSWQTRRPVFTEIFARFPTTMQLAGMSVALALILGIPLGVLSATKQYTIFDAGANFIGLLGASIPSFWQGMIFIVIFAVSFRWLPSSGWMTPWHWILPVATVGTSGTAMIMRMTRSTMLEVVKQDYIRTARAKGQKEGRILYGHALKNALIPVTTEAGMQFGFLLGGTVLAETIFAIPGLGRFLIDAIMVRDLPIILGGVLLYAVTFSIVNLMVDILYAFIDPRIRAQYR